MGKKLWIIFFALSLMLAMLPATAPAADGSERLTDGTVALYIGSENALVNGNLKAIDKENTSVKTILKGNRAFVPVRFVSENFGASVQWLESENKVIIKISDGEVSFIINQPKMMVKGKEFLLDTSPFISEGRTYLPMRAVSEALGKEVFYSKGLIIVSSQKDIFNDSESDLVNGVIDKLNNLPVVGNFENLKKLLNVSEEGIQPRMYATADVAESKQKNTKAEAVSGSGGGSSDYSKTNVQVDGVDESDVIKTDGEYIYKVNNNEVVITKAYPADRMKVVAHIQNAEGFTPTEIYVDAKRLVVIGSSNNYKPFYSDSSTENNKKIAAHYYQNENVTKALVYDISDKTKPVKTRELEVEGYYLSSRKIGSNLYLVTNKNLYFYGDFKEPQAVPYYRDSTGNGDAQAIPLSQIRYFPNFESRSYLITASLNLDNVEQGLQVSAYLGSGNNVYVSAENMYVAVQTYNIQPLTGETKANIMPRRHNDINTTIYKFSIKDGKTAFLSKGEVSGMVLNQFSMDEHDGYFRIATTSNMWSDKMVNDLYVLDATMNTVGKIEDIAPGEKIYSVRFMGVKAYIVTFRTIDPLFVIDLAEPTNPKILGKLKIPGYSDYLHPYDENHIIGFGKDTTVTKDGRALYLGIKMAIFDVTDVQNPKEMFVEKIGDRGTNSPLLYDHKALLFSKDKGLLAFPVEVMKVDGNKTDEYGNPKYGQFDFQGVYVYKIGLDEGFKLTGMVSHLSNEDYLKSGDVGADYTKFIERALYIGDNLYTASQKYIKANALDGLKEIGTVDLIK